jgi:hypothetical protein
MYGAVEPKWMGRVVTRMWMEIESEGWWKVFGLFGV